ncbi:MAG: hypothetical protein HY905_17075 [Deltaproteobacteria bacterium]|nr:hypothetical protein [Deltaproteobacteria bacterium]
MKAGLKMICVDPDREFRAKVAKVADNAKDAKRERTGFRIPFASFAVLCVLCAKSAPAQTNDPQPPTRISSPAQDPRQLAEQALERLRNGEGWYGAPAAEDEADTDDGWWGVDDDDVDVDVGPGGLRDDLAAETRRDAAGHAENPRSQRASEADRTDPVEGRPSPASLPTGEDRSAVKPQVIPLPSGEGKIEGMGESFAPQLNTGTATFSIPIALPPGRAGAQPSLAIIYSSSGGNGPLGIGWDLAVPFIARQLDKGMPTYRDLSGGLANDRFKYNGGQELVQILTSGPGETFQLPGVCVDSTPCGPSGWLYFRARVEGAFLRFFLRGDGRQWKVQDKNGTWFTFGPVEDNPDVPVGVTEASLVSFTMDVGLAAPREVTYRWNLTRMTDANGNDVWYTYQRDEAASAGGYGGQAYLSDVYWNSPVSASRALANYQHHVHLVYDTTSRQDVFTGYATGFPLTTAWRLHQIIVQSVRFEDDPGEPSHTRSYILTYDPDSFLSLLTGVQLFGTECFPDPVADGTATPPSTCTVTANTALPALALSYTEVSSGQWADGFGYINDGVETFAASPDRSIDDDRTDLFDANRDGLPDLLITDPVRCGGGHCLYINETDASGRVSFVRAGDIVLPGSIGADFTMSNTNVNPLDIDADGAVEWMHMPHSLWYRYFRLEHDGEAPADPADLWLGGYRWQEYGPFDPGVVDPDIDFTRDASEIRLVDVNNDHLVDVVRTTGTRMEHWINLSRCGTDDFYDGRFGTPVIDAFGNCVGAEEDASGRDQPIATCVLHRGMSIQFSDGDIRLSDMNGDGLQDIVQLKSGDIAYWPGRGYIAGQSDPIFWGVAADRESCEAGTYGPDLEQTMANSPHILTIEDDARISLADVNADGLTDLVQVRFDAVDVYLNLGGFAWSDRVILDGVPYHPGIVNRVRVADVNGSTTTDVLWGNGRNYQFLDFTDGIQPRLLVSVANGMGKTSEISYRSTTTYAAEARATVDETAGQVRPWTAFAPFPSQVVASSTVSDGLGGHYVTEYKYRNAFYDGWEAEFRGFGEAMVKTVGDSNSPASVSVTRFEPGLMPEWARGNAAGHDSYEDHPLLNPNCRFQENPLEALKGAVTSTETCDEGRWNNAPTSICQGAATSRYGVRRLYQPGLGGRSVWHAYAKDSYLWVYDTSVRPTGTVPASPAGGYSVYDGAVDDGTVGSLGGGSWDLRVKNLGAGQQYVLHSAVADVDFWGNVGTSVNEGAIDPTGADPDFLDDEVTTHARYDAALIRILYMHPVAESWTESDIAGEKLVDAFTIFEPGDPCGHLPRFVYIVGSDPEHWNAPDASLSYIRSEVEYDADRFCQPHHTCAGGTCSAPMGQAWLEYDADFAASPVQETIDVSGPSTTGPTAGVRSNGSPATLSTSATWFAEYGAIRTATDPSGLETTVLLDRLGRPTRMYRSGCGEPVAEIDYHLRAALSFVHTRTNEDCDSTGRVDAIAGEALEAWAYVDGMGRSRTAIAEGDAEDGLDYIQSGVQSFDAKGAVRQAFLPSVARSPDLPDGVAPASPSLYARSSYDPFGRVARAWTTDGTEVVATRYGALVTDIWDAGDLGPGVYHGTPATAYTDGQGRTVRTVERNRSADSPGLEIFATGLRYNPLGAVVEMTRGRTGGDARDAAFSSTESVTKTQTYDTLGRRVVNDDPDAGLYRYAYDPLDRLIATKDARRITNRYWYDRGGRLVAEDLEGEVPYASGSWATSGGAAGQTCTLGDDNLPPAGHAPCFDVLYRFDEAYSPASTGWSAPILAEPIPPCGTRPTRQGPLDGRPSWTRDRAGTVVLGYDCHGWAIWSGRQIHPDVTTGYFSHSVFDEGQRLQLEANPDTSLMAYSYGQRGLVETVSFLEVGAAAYQPLVRRTEYDVQGRKVLVEYGDQVCRDSLTDLYCTPSEDGSASTCVCSTAGTLETYAFDARQRLARKSDVRQFDGLVLQDYRYTYDSASNIVRIDDGRPDCWVAMDDGIEPSAECAETAEHRTFVTYDIEYEYDALYRLTKAEPLYKRQQPDRVAAQTWTFDALGSMRTWDDDDDHFYGWSLGNIVNGLQVGADPGLGPLPVSDDPACRASNGTDPGREDILGRCVADRAGNAAPHAVYAATAAAGDDELRAYYDAAGNIAALVVHRPRGCSQENATGGPDGEGCKEAADFGLFFAWDEVGNMIAAERRTPVVQPTGDPSPGDDCSLDPSSASTVFHASGESVWWCPATRLVNLYDFSNQRRVKYEEYPDGNPFEMSEGYSLYISGMHEKRDGHLDAGVYSGMDSSYLRDGLATVWELDVQGPDATDRGKLRLVLTDHLANACDVVDALAGGLLRQSSQVPYGADEKVVSANASPVGRYQFMGKEEDPGAGVASFGARYFGVRVGRWLSADPAAYHYSQSSSPAPRSTVDANCFRFARGTPVVLVDPNGLETILAGEASRSDVESDPAAIQSRSQQSEMRAQEQVDIIAGVSGLVNPGEEKYYHHECNGTACFLRMATPEQVESELHRVSDYYRGWYERASTQEWTTYVVSGANPNRGAPGLSVPVTDQSASIAWIEDPVARARRSGARNAELDSYRLSGGAVLYEEGVIHSRGYQLDFSWRYGTVPFLMQASGVPSDDAEGNFARMRIAGTYLLTAHSYSQTGCAGAGTAGPCRQPGRMFISPTMHSIFKQFGIDPTRPTWTDRAVTEWYDTFQRALDSP